MNFLTKYKFEYLLQKPVVSPGAGDPYTSSIYTSCDNVFLRIREPMNNPVTLSSPMIRIP